MTLPARKMIVRDLVNEYAEKIAGLADALKRREDANRQFNMETTVSGAYAPQEWRDSVVHYSGAERRLRTSAWQALFDRLHIKTLATPSEWDKLESFLQQPSDFTIDAIRDKVGAYVIDPYMSILRGLVEVFSGLDQSFRSHRKVAIGVDGLPKRVILHGFGEFSSFGHKRLTAVINAVRALEQKKLCEYRDISHMIQHGHLPDDTEMELRVFKNGNAHLHFARPKLDIINRGLADFYGPVLADCPEERPEREKSRAVSKDLAYYPTPAKTIDYMLNDCGLLFSGARTMLEPSCGDGRIMDYVRSKWHHIKQLGIEYDSGRAAQCHAKGHSVRCANFLETMPDPIYDVIVMNPPFAGQHWRKHLDHAMKFLADGGTLFCILPASANDDDEFGRQFHHFPVGSFSESGTNVNTGYIVKRKAK